MLQKEGVCNVKNLDILKKNNMEINAITKEAIEQALISLIKEKDFKDITITEITKKAGVSRTAYYRNYNSKEDILSNCLQRIMNTTSKILLKFDPIKDTKDSWIVLLNSVKENYSEYKLLLKSGYRDIIISEFNKCINKNISKSKIETYYSNLYWSGAISNVIFEWLENDMNVPIETIADIGCNLMINGIKTISIYGNRKSNKD